MVAVSRDAGHSAIIIVIYYTRVVARTSPPWADRKPLFFDVMPCQGTKTGGIY